MTTTTLYSNNRTTVISQCFNRLKGFILLYSSLLFICVPLYTALNYDKIVKYINPQLVDANNLNITNIFTFFDFFIEIFISTVIPVFMVMLVFRYLHNKNAIDFYHSLPISRTSLLIRNFICGYFAITLPFIANYLIKIAIIFSKVSQFSVVFLGIKNIFIFSILIFIVYSFCTIVAVSVGTTLECFGYSLAVCGALTVMGFITTNFCVDLYGFAKQSEFIENCFNLSPFGLVISYISKMDKIPLIPLCIWTVLSIFALFAANYLYKIRKSEIADVAGRQNPLSIMIRFIGAFCGGIVLFMLFHSNSEIPFIACAVGGFLGYIIVEVIFARGFITVKKSLTLSLASAVIMCAYGAFFQFGGFGFEKRVPNFSDIKSVTISQVGPYSFPLASESMDKVFGDLNPAYTLYEEDSKQSILDIHNMVVNYYGLTPKDNETNNNFLTGNDFKITYKLKNGSTLSRNYYLYGNTEIQKAYAKLYDINEIKKAGTFVFHTTGDIVDSVTISNKIGSHSEKMSLSNAEIDELLTALQKDVLSRNYNSLVDTPSNDYGTLSFAITNKNAKSIDARLSKRQIIISENDVNTINVLKGLKTFDIFLKGYDDVNSIVLFAGNDMYQKHLIQCSNTFDNYLNEYTPQHCITIEDSNTIKSIIDKSELYFINDEDIGKSSVPFLLNFENGYSSTRYIRIKNIPPSVFEDGKKYYTPSDKEINELINILIKTRDYTSSLDYIYGIYNRENHNQNINNQELEFLKKDVILYDNSEIRESYNDILYSTPAAYLYYLKNAIK